MTPIDRPRRSALYLPASNAKALAKARTLPCDVVILDLEDAVAPEAKEEARAAAVAAIAQGGFGHREVAIRVNGLDTEWGAADLAAVAGSKADAVLVPKVNGPQDIDRLQDALSGAPEAMQLWAMIETCASVFALEPIAAKARSTRLSLWIMGLNDLAKEMRAQSVPERTPFLPFLSMAVAAARAHGVTVLDGVCNEFRDLGVFEAEARQGLLFGFDGKSLIHPAQIEPCNTVFSPSEADLGWAASVIAAFALPENKGKGAIKVDGKMTELLHLEQARRLVAVAEQIAASV
ncbi:CoA ester lyase [Novosphingobium resinovorum]|uniref:Citrate lyase subunit beta n=1 Tax=Novosphingobium resinovorum TaxID=158500 RepID=A0A031K6K9_9SPHN|nr:MULTISPECIES: CoA ester lyase [Novosphingobium]AOR75828.1 malyl-CoA thiolesterase [Novosphingobium resinovorum]EZP84824.1 Citrate lyase subunit beta [Novosphingobium resinovorum]MBF7011190.1 CoA ester lyase [Novosphingobium sp. HR1a]WJM29177.1 CoA ester lyase [Novosphingobium resinovorum]